MKRTLLALLFCALCALLAAPAAPKVFAQDGIQEFSGTVDDDNELVSFALGDLNAGDFVYAIAEAAEDSELDTLLLLTDADGEEVFARYDDMSSEDYNSALVYRVEDDGEFAIAVSRFNADTEGDFDLRVGINLPELFPLGNTARSTREETGTVDEDNPTVYFDIPDLQAGDNVFLYAEATSGDLDTLIGIGDAGFANVLAAADDIAPGNFNSALYFVVKEDGDYSAAVTGYDETLSGDFRLIIGINAPEVLAGLTDTPERAERVSGGGLGGQLAESGRGGAGEGGDGWVQAFTGELTEDAPVHWYDLYGMREGETIYIYAEETDGSLDTLIAIGDILLQDVFAENDDIDPPDNSNSALEYTFPEDNDYSVAITSAERGSYGEYRIVFGLNAPDVLTGDAEPRGEAFVERYQGQ